MPPLVEPFESERHCSHSCGSVNDDGGFNDSVARIIDDHVSHRELGSSFLLFCPATHLIGHIESVDPGIQRSVHLVGDVAGELNGFAKPVNAFDDAPNESLREFGGVG